MRSSSSPLRVPSFLNQIGPIAARVCLAVYLNGLRSTMLTTIVKRYVSRRKQRIKARQCREVLVVRFYGSMTLSHSILPKCFLSYVTMRVFPASLSMAAW